MTENGGSGEGCGERVPSQWLRDQEAPFQGWDFSYLRDRMHEDDPPWNYPRSARSLVAGSRRVLDIATGGGEVFSSLAPFPPLAVAIEGYPPNARIARDRLAPLGAGVVRCGEVESLPFPAGTFDLVLNRHGGLRVEEIGRVLAPGGRFLTQQVGGDHLVDLLARFGARPQWPENLLANVTARLRAVGFEVIEAREWRGEVTLGDVGAIVYLLKAVPWMVPGFTVERYLGVLKALETGSDRGESLRFVSSHFFIHANKPAH